MRVWRRFRAGIKLGLLLQLAVGPSCLFVMRAASDQGLQAGLAAAGAVFIVDCLFVLLAVLGVGRWVGGGGDRPGLRYGAAVVVALFAVDIGVSAFGRSLLPTASFLSFGPQAGPFLGAFVLTAANPLTIAFWAGIFGAKIAAERWERRDILPFSTGCVSSTLLFLTAVALVGSVVGFVAPGWMLRALNLIVGAALVVLAIRLAVPRGSHVG
jgi:arginine exporter protein ArgO